MSPSEFQNRILLTTCLAVIIATAGGYGVGFLHGRYFQKYYQKREKPCVGYTVLDSAHVLNCDGDTVRYEWNKQ